MSQPWTPIPMGQPPGPYPPYPVAPPPLLQPQKPSTVYKVVGILAMVLGIGGVLWKLVSLATTALATSLSTATSAIYDGPTLAFLYAYAGLGILTGALLAGTGLGVLRAKRWARTLGLVYAAMSLGVTLVGTAVQVLVITPRMYASMPSLPISDKMRIFTTASAIVGAVVVSLVPILMAIALLHPRAKQELDQ